MEKCHNAKNQFRKLLQRIGSPIEIIDNEIIFFGGKTMLNKPANRTTRRLLILLFVLTLLMIGTIIISLKTINSAYVEDSSFDITTETGGTDGYSLNQSETNTVLTIKEKTGTPNNNKFIVYTPPTKYTVIFYDEDGATELWKKTDYEYGNTITYGGVTPTKQASNTQNFVFNCWTNDFENGVTTVNGNMTFTAIFAASTRYYTVNFYDEDGSTILWEKTDYEYGNIITYGGITPTKDASNTQNFAFSGWTNDFENGVTTVNGNMTFSAIFSSNTRYYTVTFYDEDGKTVLWQKTDCEYGSIITYGGNLPAKASFNVWNNDFENGVTTVTDDNMAFKALYTASDTADSSNLWWLWLLIGLLIIVAGLILLRQIFVKKRLGKEKNNMWALYFFRKLLYFVKY